MLIEWLDDLLGEMLVGNLDKTFGRRWGEIKIIHSHIPIPDKPFMFSKHLSTVYSVEMLICDTKR